MIMFLIIPEIPLGISLAKDVSDFSFSKSIMERQLTNDRVPVIDTWPVIDLFLGFNQIITTKFDVNIVFIFKCNRASSMFNDDPWIPLTSLNLFRPQRTHKMTKSIHYPCVTCHTKLSAKKIIPNIFIPDFSKIFLSQIDSYATESNSRNFLAAFNLQQTLSLNSP